MSTRLDRRWIEFAIDHLAKYGDTDIFPRPFELAFFAEAKKEIADELSSYDLSTHRPLSVIECLSPKSRLGFRIAHQLFPIDTLLFTSAAASVGEQIEKSRLPKAIAAAFSYRFGNLTDSDFFSTDCDYSAWLQKQREIVDANPKIHTVVFTDISDFYHKVYFHRLENALRNCCSDEGICSFVLNFIKHIRARQSFGLPVGGNAARILAELALSDTDSALLDKSVLSTRYVDDFRIFVREGEDPYEITSFLAEHLAVNEGLTLNASKTRVMGRDKFLAILGDEGRDLFAEAGDAALSDLQKFVYADEEIPKELLDKFRAVNLVGMIEGELGSEEWDVGRIKVLLKALRYVQPDDVGPFIREWLPKALIFAKEFTLLMIALMQDALADFSDMKNSVLECLKSPIAKNLPLVRAWLLQLFVFRVIPLARSEVSALEGLTTTLEQRQIMLVRGTLKDVNFFRRHKTRFDELNPWEKPAFIFGASCLPDDEYSTWLNAIRHRKDFLLFSTFVEWARVYAKKRIEDARFEL